MHPEERKSLGPIEKKREAKIEKRRRVARWGEVFIDRKVVHESLRFPFEPDWNLSPLPLQGVFKEGKLRSLSKGRVQPQTLGADISQEQLLKPIQEQFFGNIYVFSDTEENLEDLEKRYKYLGAGLRNYAKQKKKQNAEKAASLVDA